MPGSALILGCSERKRLDTALLPAVERYDGPSFRLVRRFLREGIRAGGTGRPALYILSAEFGLIPADKLIPWYDRTMTRHRAHELQRTTVETLERVVVEQEVNEVCVAVGKFYLDALTGFPVASTGVPVRILTGSSGRRLSMLHDWLHGRAPVPPTVRVDSAADTIRFRGVYVSRNPNLVSAAAGAGLQEDPAGAARFQGWCVEIDGMRVAPKWLVSRITGLPVSAFHSDDARRLLVQLGLEVRRP
ncbi:MAG: DUF6884 domain-containing protein [Armatimonadota bacterium]